MSDFIYVGGGILDPLFEELRLRIQQHNQQSAAAPEHASGLFDRFLASFNKLQRRNVDDCIKTGICKTHVVRRACFFFYTARRLTKTLWENTKAGNFVPVLSQPSLYNRRATPDT